MKPSIAISPASKQDRYNEISIEMQRHLEDVELNKSAHFYRSSILRNWINYTNLLVYFSLWGLVFLWFVSTQVVLLLKYFNIVFNDSMNLVINSIAPIILVIIGLLGTTLQYFGGYQELERGHWRAAMRYQRLFRKIKNWKTDCPSSSHSEYFWIEVKKLRQEITDANEDSPDLAENDWKTAHLLLSEGATEYKVDE